VLFTYENVAFVELGYNPFVCEDKAAESGQERGEAAFQALHGEDFHKLRQVALALNFLHVALPAAAADSKSVHPSASFVRITLPRQSKFMGGQYLKLGFKSITHAAGRVEDDNRAKKSAIHLPSSFRCVFERFFAFSALFLAASNPT
jgi:hypothetical protein